MNEILEGPECNMKVWACAAVISLSAGIVAAQESGAPVRSIGPVSPADSLSQFELHPAVTIELIAAEPQVVDPVAIAFDEENRLWVVEMRDYPHGPAENEPPRSRIKVLTDQDGDGFYETATLFADQLLFANGIQPWRGGVIVTLAGEIAYLRDTNGDGRADLRETWFTGFAQENPQLRANHPTLGLDGWIYIANGLRNGDVIARKPGWSPHAKPMSLSGMDFRFHPHTGAYETVSGFGQFGLTFDDFGRRFVCSNRNPCKHVVFENDELRRNPSLAVSAVTYDVSPAGPDSSVYPLTSAWTTSTLHAGQFTAACGVTIYRGDALPEEFRGNSFTCEPTGNLVHRDVLSPSGGTFTSRPGRKDVEFLASRDDWFRPVNLANGPDGALYVVDMYRAVIEHPQFMPAELKSRRDLLDGLDRGRIYRITARSQTHRVLPSLSKSSNEDLVGHLDHSNSWQRETATRLLWERRANDVAERLELLARSGEQPAGRVHALHLLHNLDRLSGDVLTDALRDRHPRVREMALQLAETQLKSHSELQSLVHSLSKDDDERVRFRVALSLGLVGDDNDRKVDSLVDVAERCSDDSWTRTAVLLSTGNSPLAFFQRLLKRSKRSHNAGAIEMTKETAELIGSRRRPEEIQAVLSSLVDANSRSELQSASLLGLGRGLQRRGQHLRTYFERLDEAQREAFAEIFRRTAGVATSDQSLRERRQAVDLLVHSPPEIALPVLKQLSTAEPNQALRTAAISAWSRFDDDAMAQSLLEMFSAGTPVVRRTILDALLNNTERTGQLLDAIESGRIAVMELDATHSNRLLRHRDKTIRERAEALHQAAISTDRVEVIAQYRPALDEPADPQIGRELFAKNCASCHRVADVGVDVAPDIADSRTKTPDQLLTDILDPNRAVDNNYFSYTVVTIDGRTFTGIVVSETPTTVTLKEPDAKMRTLFREQIDLMKSNGISLMPIGFEKKLSPKELAAVISFIKNWRYLDGEVPIDLNTPPRDSK